MDMDPSQNLLVLRTKEGQSLQRRHQNCSEVERWTEPVGEGSILLPESAWRRHWHIDPGDSGAWASVVSLWSSCLALWVWSLFP